MKPLLAIFAIAGVTIAASTGALRWERVSAMVGTAQQWARGNGAQARGGGSRACIQNCVNVRRCPAAQCRQYCKGKRWRTATAADTSYPAPTA